MTERGPKGQDRGIICPEIVHVSIPKGKTIILSSEQENRGNYMKPTVSKLHDIEEPLKVNILTILTCSVSVSASH